MSDEKKTTGSGKDWRFDPARFWESQAKELEGQLERAQDVIVEYEKELTEYRAAGQQRGNIGEEPTEPELKQARLVLLSSRQVHKMATPANHRRAPRQSPQQPAGTRIDQFVEIVERHPDGIMPLDAAKHMSNASKSIRTQIYRIMRAATAAGKIVEREDGRLVRAHSMKGDLDA